MFESLKYIESTFSIVFPRQERIRRDSNKIEEKLDSLKSENINYAQPQIIPIPDEMDPRIPRIIFGSQHGYSQIIVSQVSLALQVNYSTDWQNDAAKVQEYLHSRIPVLFQLFDVISPSQAFVSGLSTTAQLPFTGRDQDLISCLSKIYLSDHINRKRNVHELYVKHADIIDDKYFCNVAVENYRTWDIEESGLPEMTPLSSKTASNRGVAITVDFNDRYSFNENTGYNSSGDAAPNIIDNVFKCITNESELISGE